MRELYREFVRFFISLRLTVALLALSALLVFLATIDQVHLGIWAVQEKWFKSLIVLHDIKGFPVPVFPGGYFIGGLLLINLVGAHAKRFALTWKKAGIQLVHFGLILLLLGELFTGLFQEEYQMRLDEGQTRNYSESWRFNELAIADTTSPDEDVVTVIPEKRLARAAGGDGDIQVSALPFRVIPRAYYPNAALAMKEQAPPMLKPVENSSTRGLGPRLLLAPLPMTYKQDQRNLPAALVELVGPEGSLGVFLLSTMITEPERFSYAGREWAMSLRFQRAYKPYSLTLLDFSHDRYAGTDIPKNFSSRVRLATADGVNDREVLIFMNNPLRHDGMTFYQAGFDNNDKTTVLQVVRNPSWVIPYLSCLLMAVGLFWQFGWHLVVFTARRGSSPALRSEAPAPVVALGLVLALRLMAGLVGLWVTASTDGMPAAVGLGVLALEFLACAALLAGLASRGAWSRPLLGAYAWASLLVLAGVLAYGFLGGDIYDAILRWVVIGLHVLTAAALLSLARAFRRPEVDAWFSAPRPSSTPASA